MSRNQVRKEVREVMQGFSGFLHKYSVIPLAIGVVLGTAVNDLVKSVVEGLISPFIALVTPGKTLASWTIGVGGSTFLVGSVVDALIRFLSVALIVYVTAKYFLKRADIIENPPK